ncbi:heme lyase CcmF/NrfE family subunit [Denitratimonas tolerans]|uniref:Heme lyase CcmF/NrfE family subunit n=1 Tax=Denitratimonas tolerans TaxID=1338420 RepID=A0AAW9R099_9GAMM
MLPELGNFALILALVIALALATLPLIGAWRKQAALIATARPAALGQFVFVALSFVILAIAFVQGDFSVQYVAQNSNSLLPVMYRISAVWGAHEGSLLLWILILAGWTLAVAVFSRNLPDEVVARVLGVLGWVSVGFLAFVLFTSNPFDRLLPAAAEGRDLNPMLQDVGLILHPPMLYFGYVGFSVAFAFAVASLLGRELDPRWVRWARPWTNVAWAFMTIGIALGSWWAYYELGWGGWWFWDPVENASFMPWLVGTALIHSQAVTEKRGGFRGWTILLAIAAFSLSLLGTFIVRSGVLTSVHAFASDPGRGVFILIFLIVVTGGSLLLYALRAPGQEAGKPFAALSRETLLLINNLMLSAAAAMVLVGTLSPLLFEALNLGKISVGPPYFATQFVWLMLPVVVLLPFGPFARWGREQFPRLLPTLRISFACAVIAATIAWLLGDGWDILAIAGVAGSAWILGGVALYAIQRIRQMPAGRRFPPEMLGMLLAHTGVAVFIVGALVVETVGVEKDVAVSPGQVTEVRGYEFRFDGVSHKVGPNYEADRGTVTVTAKGRQIAVLHPEKRAYASGGQVMTEAAIAPGLFRDLYVALGEPLGAENWALRIYVKPFVRWIWLGALMMMLGGFIAAADRRFRRDLAPSREAIDAPSTDAPASAVAAPAGVV